MKIKKSSNRANDIDLIIINKFFGLLVKDISITRYRNDKQLIPTSSPYEIYQYSDAMLKHLPGDALKQFKKDYYTVKRLSITTMLT